MAKMWSLTPTRDACQARLVGLAERQAKLLGPTAPVKPKNVQA